MSLLYNEPPVAVSPTLMTIFGVPEAMFLQQVHYWIENKKNNADKYEKSRVNGQWWVYNSLTEWQALLPYLGSESTIKRIITDLKNKGVLVIEKHNTQGFDKTNWYRINYLRLNQLIDQFNLTQRSGQNDPTISSDSPDGQVQNDPIQSVSLTRPIPETTQRLQTETTSERDIDHSPTAQAPDSESVDDFNLDSEPTTADEFNMLSQSSISEAEKKDLAPAPCGKVEKPKRTRKPKEKRDPEVPKHKPEAFAALKEQYLGTIDPVKSAEEWDRLKADDDLIGVLMHFVAEAKEGIWKGQDPFYITHLHTFLKKHGWKVQYKKPSSQPNKAKQQLDNDGSDELWAILRGEAV